MNARGAGAVAQEINMKFVTGNFIIIMSGSTTFYWALAVVDTIPWTGDQPVARALPKPRISTNTRTLRAGFEPTISVFERAKKVHALDRAATVIGTGRYY
jgi:hypothetical protein